MLPLTHLWFLLEVLFACSSSPPWNLPSFTMDLTRSPPCSCSNPPFSYQGVALAHLDSLPPHDLVIQTDRFVHFLFGRGSSGVLDNCSLCGTEANLSFLAGPMYTSFSAEACAILQAMGWCRQYQQVWNLSSPPLRLSLCPLFHLSFTSNSLVVT